VGIFHFASVFGEKVEKPLSEVLNEIKNALNLTQVQLASAIGVNIDRVKSLASGKATNLTRKETKMLVENLHINPVWLTTGKGEIIHLELSDERIPYLSEPDFVLVPRYNILASAGGGAAIHSELIVDHLAFKAEWVMRMGLKPKKLALISVTGDSMEPALRHNDLVLVDLRTNHLTVDGIYAIQHRGHLHVKRVQSKLDGTVIIRSDNTMYEPEVLKEEDKDNFVVVGRVVWFGREV